jgi:hypothetical protein
MNKLRVVSAIIDWIEMRIVKDFVARSVKRSESFAFCNLKKSKCMQIQSSMLGLE